MFVFPAGTSPAETAALESFYRSLLVHERCDQHGEAALVLRVGEATDDLRHQPMFVQVLHDAPAPLLHAFELETCCAQFAYDLGLLMRPSMG